MELTLNKFEEYIIPTKDQKNNQKMIPKNEIARTKNEKNKKNK